MTTTNAREHRCSYGGVCAEAPTTLARDEEEARRGEVTTRLLVARCRSRQVRQLRAEKMPTDPDHLDLRPVEPLFELCPEALEVVVVVAEGAVAVDLRFEARSLRDLAR